jgi:DNA-binding LacI/PurR family transcriptional regulator
MPETILYDLVNPEALDGLISWASSVGGCLSDEEIARFHTRYDPLPIVSITFPLKGKPTVMADNYQGMREVLVHLIEVHGYRHLAFIRGPEHHAYAQERYQAYLDVLKDYDIPFDPALVTPPSDYVRSKGTEAVYLLLDERRLRLQRDMEAIVAASDLFALGALTALQARGIRVPREIAVVGFNDSLEGRYAVPH